MTSREPVAWVLNLDADDALAAPGLRTTRPSMVDRIQRLVHVLSMPGGLIGPEDQILWPPQSTSVEKGRLGMAWCPTGWAVDHMASAGLRVSRSPGDVVLKTVNHRRFNVEMGQSLPYSAFFSDGRALEEHLHRVNIDTVSFTNTWVLKRPLSYAGRGRRKVSATLSPEDRAWISASLRGGDGLSVEPWVEREADFALHGYVGTDGQCTLGQPTAQVVTEQGAWYTTSLAPSGALSEKEVSLLQSEGKRTAEALRRAGYFGPFGIDAFRWKSPDGRVHFQPRIEVNARYSMGWAIGMGELRTLGREAR